MDAEIADLAHVDAVEAGGAGGTGFEEGGHPRTGVLVAVEDDEFREVEQGPAAEKEQGGHEPDDAGMNAQARASDFTTEQAGDAAAKIMKGVVDDERAKTTGDGEQGDDDLKGAVVFDPFVGEAVGQGGESGIAEGGDGMEDGLVDALGGGAVLRQAEVDGDGSDGFSDEGEEEDESQGFADMGETFFGDHFSEKKAVVKAHALEQHGGHEEGDGHDAQSAKLDEHEEDHLTSGGKKFGGVVDHKAGDADGAGAGEERVKPGEGVALGDRERHFEQQGADDHHGAKAAHEQPAGSEGDSGEAGLVAQAAQKKSDENDGLDSGVGEQGEFVIVTIDPTRDRQHHHECKSDDGDHQEPEFTLGFFAALEDVGQGEDLLEGEQHRESEGDEVDGWGYLTDEPELDDKGRQGTDASKKGEQAGPAVKTGGIGIVGRVELLLQSGSLGFWVARRE